MQKIAILYDASHAVLSTFDLDEVLNQILTIVRDYFHLRSGAILLLNRAAKTLTIRAEFSPHYLQKDRSIPLGKGITGSAAKLKRPIYAADVRKEARYIEGDPDTKSELAIPLIVQDEVVGVLDCQSDQVNAFDNETVDLLTLFATNAAIALQNSELYNRERRRATQLETIYKVARQTTAVLDLNELLGTMCSLLPDAFGADHVCVFLLDSDQKLILRREQGKLKCRVREGEPFPTQPGYSESVLSLGQGILANDMTPDLGACENTGSEMCVPLISFGQRIGLVICSSARKDAYHPDDLKSLESMADILATAIQNAGYVEQVRMQANLDGLTGIFNRRYFEMKILEKMSEASRYGGNMALLMLDIDHFKAINDEFGHLLGDEVLKQVSGLLSHNLRKVDLLCRYGGEEYAIIAPATDGEHARSFADKLRRMIELFQFPGVPRSVTVSIGVAEFPIHGKSRDALVRAADAALYEAKELGRNRVAIARAFSPEAKK